MARYSVQPRDQVFLKGYEFLSLRLTGVETLESVSQKFKCRFHFLFLVSVTMDKLAAR